MRGAPHYLCEHTFVTSQGSPTARFRRALATGNATLVLEAAGRWLGRLILERGLPLEQGLRAAAALVELGTAPRAADPRTTLQALLRKFT
jgi:hypothetical protein